VRGLSHRSPLIIVGAVAVVVFLVLFLIWPAWAYHLDWTGFGASRSPVKSPKALFDYYPAKSLWDWMQLLLIAAVLVLAGFLLNSAQQHRERDIAKDNRAQDLDIADKNRAQDQTIAEERQQEATLEAYLVMMTMLLLDKGLKEPMARSEVRAMLRRLNGERKAVVMRFLYESFLIDKDAPIVALAGADLRLANLSWTVLKGADLQAINLQGAILSGANLEGADLTLADLCRANLQGTILSRAVLRGVIGKTAEELEHEAASLTGAIMPDGLIHP